MGDAVAARLAKKKPAKLTAPAPQASGQNVKDAATAKLDPVYGEALKGYAKTGGYGKDFKARFAADLASGDPDRLAQAGVLVKAEKALKNARRQALAKRDGAKNVQGDKSLPGGSAADSLGKTSSSKVSMPEVQQGKEDSVNPITRFVIDKTLGWGPLTPEKAEKSMKWHRDRFKKKNWPDATDNLNRYLSGKGGKKKYTSEQARAFKPISKAEQRIRKHFENGTFLGITDEAEAPRKLMTLQDGQPYKFGDKQDGIYDKWDFGYDALMGDKNFAIAHGKTNVNGKGDFKATRHGDRIHIKGKVEYKWSDKYNFDKGQPGYKEAMALEKQGKAKPFEFGADWTQEVEGWVEIKNGKLTNPRFNWRDIKP